ncbi:MAG: hypothetical protein DRQ57_16275 [Gammaproteobacteria bacterium]|nr:MAG: hypothetical protein DRQ57_16275 [Gammaproteobacteria bacterium]
MATKRDGQYWMIGWNCPNQLCTGQKILRGQSLVVAQFKEYLIIKMKFKTFFYGLLLLILAPIGIISGFIAYTHWFNALPQTGYLHSEVTPQILFSGERAEYSITYHGNLIPKPSGKLKPLDMIFVVDISSSMDQTLPDMIQAAWTVAQELDQGYAGTARLALIPFNTSAYIEVPWTNDINTFYVGLNKLTPSGLTDGLASFPSIQQLIDQARPEADKVVVFYTDGQVDNVDKMAGKVDGLRRRKVETYTVITPSGGNPSNMIMIMDNPAHVLVPHNAKDLATAFRKVADQVTGIYAKGAQLLHYIDGRHFATPLEDDSSWRVNNNALQLNIGYLPYRSMTYKHPLVPKSIGLWTVGNEPPQVNFLDKQNQPQSHDCSRQPRLLVLSWWLLLLAFLPALWWIWNYLKYRWESEKTEESRYTPPSIHSPLPPSALPLPVPPIRPRKTVIPTLFIGIGGAGRTALYATQDALKAAHLGNSQQPYHFMWLDLSHESNLKVPFEAWQAFSVEEIIAPSSVCKITIPSGETHLNWFDADKHIHDAHDVLNLSQGAQGQRDLARLALFQWLKSAELLPQLEAAYQKLLAFESIEGTRQIILFADRTGGVGSGWLIDIARLLRRLARKTREKNHLDFIPDMIGIINAPTYPERGQANQQALDMELEVAQLTGAFPQRMVYSLEPEPALLAQTDTEAPFNWLFSVAEDDAIQRASQCAELSAVLVERYPRLSLLSERGTSRKIAATHLNSLHVLPDLDLQLVKLEILLRILGKEVLLDLERDPADQLTIPKIPEVKAMDLLEQWVEREPKGSALQRFLQLAINSDISDQFQEIIAENRIPELSWFQQAFTVFLNQQLWGKRNDKQRWIREEMPGQVIAVLRLLAHRLTSVKDEISLPNNQDKFLNILEKIIQLATGAANQLQTWLDEFIPLCETAWQERHSLEQRRATVGAWKNLLTDTSSNHQQIVQWTEQAMLEWVSQIDSASVDITSALCERFFFAAQFDQGDIKIMLSAYVSTYIAKPQQAFYSAEMAKTAIENYANQIAQLVPTLTVEGALAKMDNPCLRDQLARNMLKHQNDADQILVVTPTVINGNEKDMIHEFKTTIPAGDINQKQDCDGDDHAAIRVVTLKDEFSDMSAENLPFIQDAEQTAEQVRQRAQMHFKMQMPVFPTALRIALSHPNAFRSFACAYQAGHIDQGEDENGANQWFFKDQGEFLTFDKDSSLAVAAANYVYYHFQNPPHAFVEDDHGGDFSRLEAWLKKGGIPDDDVLVLVAIKMDESS